MLPRVRTPGGVHSYAGVKSHFCVLICAAAFLTGNSTVLLAQGDSDQDWLFQEMVGQPTNYKLTFEFAQAATAKGDYEAAIGALERLLFYNADLPLVKYELGSLYFRLGSYDMAVRYFSEALASPHLDAATKSRIEAYLPDAQQQLQQSRTSVLVQTGIRYQSDANFGPSGNILLNGQTQSLLPEATHHPDGNAYEIIGFSNDYDLQDQKGDVLETRLATYDSQQFRFSDLNVDMFDLTVGPRMPLTAAGLAGATLKPYFVGGMTFVGGAPYLASQGAGVQVSLPISARFSVGPLFEWRHEEYPDVTPTSVFGTGDLFTGGVTSTFEVDDHIKIEAHSFYRRGTAAADYQSFNQWVEEAALTFSFAPALTSIPYDWSLSPFVRYLHTGFDAANPFVNPLVVQVDNEWAGGIVVNAPMTRTFGLTATVEYDYTGSSLPNYRIRNLSLMAGPTARF